MLGCGSAAHDLQPGSEVWFAQVVLLLQGERGQGRSAVLCLCAAQHSDGEIAASSARSRQTAGQTTPRAQARASCATLQHARAWWQHHPCTNTTTDTTDTTLRGQRPGAPVLQHGQASPATRSSPPPQKVRPRDDVGVAANTRWQREMRQRIRLSVREV